ncbi:hypothetical protein [Dickeya zeae]|uniref:hypothetical protein n=1 Tax=Dickeya zeae TaxID=204042 RepID=UPI000375B880|nr:hypothetical protein [Dickeya zeae]
MKSCVVLLAGLVIHPVIGHIADLRGFHSYAGCMITESSRQENKRGHRILRARSKQSRLVTAVMLLPMNIEACAAGGVKPFSVVTPVPSPVNLPRPNNIDNFPQTSLAAARLKLNELKLLRQEGRCQASELKQDKLQRVNEFVQAK